MIIKPFEQWREDRIAAAAKLGGGAEAEFEAAEPVEKTVQCSACNGDGVTYCDCNCPNCEAEMDCDECDGSGKISTDDVEKLEKNEAGLATRDEYLKELAKDLVALSEWQGKPSLFHLVDAGMAPATMIRRGGTRILVLHDPDTGDAVDAPEGVVRT